MKTLCKYFFFAFCAFVLVFLSSCDKDEIKQQLGLTSEQPDTTTQEPEKSESDKKQVRYSNIENTNLSRAENSTPFAEEGIGVVVYIDKDNKISIQEVNVKKRTDKFYVFATSKKVKCNTMNILAQNIAPIAKKDLGVHLGQDNWASEVFAFFAVDKQVKWEKISDILMTFVSPTYKIFLYKISFLVATEANKINHIKAYIPFDRGLFGSKEKKLKLRILIEDEEICFDFISITSDSVTYRPHRDRDLPEPTYEPFHTIRWQTNANKAGQVPSKNELYSKINKTLIDNWDDLGSKIEIAPDPKLPFEHIMTTLDAIENAKNVKEKDVSLEEQKNVSFGRP